MEGSGYGYLWAISTVVMPILLAIAFAYASYQTYLYRKETRGRRKPMPGELHEHWDEAYVADRIRSIIVWSVVTFVLLMIVLVILFL
jgi:hypothetical protein